MRKLSFAAVRGNKRRVLSTSWAVILGVAFLAGTLVIGDTMRGGFSDLFEKANANTDAVVRSDTEIETEGTSQIGLLDESVADDLAGIDGVAAAVPVVERAGQIVGSDGDPIGGQGPPALAGNWITDPDHNPYQLVEGRAPKAGDEVVIDKGSAETGDLAVGDRTVVRVPEAVDVTVVGIATFGTADSAGGTTFAGFTLAAAQDLLLPEPGRLTSVVVAADDAVSQDELVRRLEAELPDGAEAITGEALTAEQNDQIQGDILGMLETFLLVFAAVALVVACFSIYNTFSIVVAQRTRESALLRALGASRRQVLGAVLAEAVVVGVVASALGIVGGLGLAVALDALMDAVGLDLPGASLVVNTDTVAVAMAVGVVVTVLASLAPAVKASRVLPLAALRDVDVDRSATSRWRLAGGVVVGGAGVAMTIAGATVVGSFPLTGLGALAVVVGVVLLGPVVARPAGGVLGAPLALRGTSGQLAQRNTVRNPKRTASTALALLVGVSVVSLFTVFAASLKGYVDDTTSEAFTGDLIVVSDSFSGVSLNPALRDAVAELPEVEVAARLGNAPLRVDGKDNWASSADGPALAQVIDPDIVSGAVEDLGAGTVLISESFADSHGWEVGSDMPVSYADGAAQTLRVAGIYEKGDLLGEVIVSEADWEPHAVQADDIAVVVGLADGVDPAAGEAAVQVVADRYYAPDVQTREEYVESVAAEIDVMLTVVYALLALAILIAVMGIANTLALSIHERRRELGLLRAVGQSRRQLRSMVRGESIVVALFGTIGGLLLGTFLGWAVISSIDTIDGSFAVPAGQLAVVLVLGAVVGFVAAVRPARRAARMDVLAAIAA